MLGLGKLVAQRCGRFRAGSRDQQVGRAPCQLARDLDDLRGRLTRPENHFRHALPEGAVMIDLGEAQILEGHVPHALDRGINAGGARAHLFKQES